MIILNGSIAPSHQSGSFEIIVNVLAVNDFSLLPFAYGKPIQILHFQLQIQPIKVFIPFLFAKTLTVSALGAKGNNKIPIRAILRCISPFFLLNRGPPG